MSALRQQRHAVSATWSASCSGTDPLRKSLAEERTQPAGKQDRGEGITRCHRRPSFRSSTVFSRASTLSLRFVPSRVSIVQRSRSQKTAGERAAISGDHQSLIAGRLPVSKDRCYPLFRLIFSSIPPIYANPFLPGHYTFTVTAISHPSHASGLFWGAMTSRSPGQSRRAYGDAPTHTCDLPPGYCRMLAFERPGNTSGGFTDDRERTKRLASDESC